jgi:hypothetical protein
MMVTTVAEKLIDRVASARKNERALRIAHHGQGHQCVTHIAPSTPLPLNQNQNQDVEGAEPGR